MSATVILPAGASEEDWLATRRTGLGGSDVAAACGISPWTSRYSLWLQKTGRAEPDFTDETLEKFRWGHKLEPVILDEFRESHPELSLTGGRGTYSFDAQPWMLANVDGLAWIGEQLAGVVEGKSGDHHQVAAWEHDESPIYYVVQAQWYLGILGAPRAYMAALLDTHTYVERVLERDEEIFADLVDLAGEFWWHVENDKAPEIDGSESTRLALARLGSEPGETCQLDGRWRKALAERAEINERVDELMAQRDVIDNELRAEMGTAEVALLGDDQAATFRASKKPKRTPNLDLLLARYPDAYADCVRESTPGRRLNYSRKGTTS